MLDRIIFSSYQCHQQKLLNTMPGGVVQQQPCVKSPSPIALDHVLLGIGSNRKVAKGVLEKRGILYFLWKFAPMHDIHMNRLKQIMYSSENLAVHSRHQTLCNCRLLVTYANEI